MTFTLPFIRRGGRLCITDLVLAFLTFLRVLIERNDLADDWVPNNISLLELDPADIVDILHDSAGLTKT